MARHRGRRGATGGSAGRIGGAATHADPRNPTGDDPGRGAHADPESVARTILLNKLTAQPRTRAELAEALAAKLVPDDVASRVLDRFEVVGLIDDAAFARSWVESRQAGRGLARRALAQELRRKGVDEGTVREAVDEIEPGAEEQAARDLVRRKLRGMRSVPHDAKVRRLAGMLARKGYPPGLTFQVVREELAAAASEAQHDADMPAAGYDDLP